MFTILLFENAKYTNKWYTLEQSACAVGGWSLLRGENSTTWSFNGESFVKERLLSSSAFFSLSVEVDALNSTRYSLAVSN